MNMFVTENPEIVVFVDPIDKNKGCKVKTNIIDGVKVKVVLCPEKFESESKGLPFDGTLTLNV